LRDITDGTTNTLMVVERSATSDGSNMLNCGGAVCGWNGGLWVGARHRGNSVGWHSGIQITDIDSYGGANSTYMIGRSSQTWGFDWSNNSTHTGGLQTVLC